MKKLDIALTVRFQSSPSVGAGSTSGTLADKTVTRNTRGQFIIPGSQVKGKLRHACEQLLRSQNVPVCHAPQAERMCPHIRKDDAGRSLPVGQDEQPLCLLCQIFGSPWYPSPLRFHDLTVTDENYPDETVRTMVSLNRQRRVAQDQRLFLVETAPNFVGLAFANGEAITGRVENKAHALLLLAGLKMLFTWGGGVSRGLGWGDGEATAKYGPDAAALELNGGTLDCLKALLPNAGGQAE